MRELAHKFKCSTITVVRAYKELEGEHFIYAVPKSGYYLVSKKGEKLESDSEIDFSTVLPDKELIPYKEFHHCLDQAMNKNKDELLSYGYPQGLPSLIDSMKRHLEDYQVFCKASQIAITSGSQQAVNILNKMDFPEGKDTVLIENPTYERMIKNLELNRTRTVGIERKFDGIDFQELEKIFKNENIKFFYTVARFHNPTGGSYSVEEKKEILRLADKYNVYIVEDDYLVDLDTKTKNDPIYAFDTRGRVIYLKTFSKILLPGLRVAAAVLPDDLMGQFLKYKQWSDVHTSILPQGALEIYMENGMFKQSKARFQKKYRERMRYLKGICDNFDPEILRANVPETGFFVSLESRKRVNPDKFIKDLAAKGVTIKDTRSSFMARNECMNLIRISVSRTDTSQIEEGVNCIYDYFADLAKATLT
ncbi:DNA-binding transcriptional regulator, MocR family, contains an aminotransferase domain [Peptoclostridium litorale DSM 5388]|uniref:Regulatory protein GntR HTH n=1 Tax=Peptoclostridium litorale DSM 5388 TaxID=1121324 RepID=A0A069RFP8_PEPLI|nr:PLP-dependent aminotransferase family protein [Peptoclostridium litorale]KDR95869.1 regulatory protein GntR HTH [Peptoclostridium litorale DSM 5388]SIO11005.1 DNA-binding transcriptional regulator, MocR family, contains an aminotransferase domain [Peptoclostridium litorale DSM 5388]